MECKNQENEEILSFIKEFEKEVINSNIRNYLLVCFFIDWT